MDNDGLQFEVRECIALWRCSPSLMCFLVRPRCYLFVTFFQCPNFSHNIIQVASLVCFRCIGHKYCNCFRNIADKSPNWACDSLYSSVAV